MHDDINRADILSCFLYMRVYSTEPPEDVRSDTGITFFVRKYRQIIFLVVRWICER